MVIPKPAHLAMPTCEMPPTLHLCDKGTKKIRYFHNDLFQKG